MKNSTALFAFFVALALFSFKNTHPNSYEQEKIVQLALNVETIEKILKKGTDDKYLPVVLITNKLVSEDMHITLKGQKVKLVSDMEEAYAMGDNFSFLELKELSVKRSNARLRFQLDDYKINVKLKNEEDEWVYSSSTSRKKGHFSLDIE